MNPGVVFLIWWAACCAAVALIILTATNFDRIAVAFLCLVDAPVYETGTTSASSSSSSYPPQPKLSATASASGWRKSSRTRRIGAGIAAGRCRSATVSGAMGR
jgi:hypothetical protein